MAKRSNNFNSINQVSINIIKVDIKIDSRIKEDFLISFQFETIFYIGVINLHLIVFYEVDFQLYFIFQIYPN